ncbi:MAG: TIM barrel protein [Kiritimatiellaeota bacterium]|nr:TIM barrel protein [Kiritimatiellota bacterium]
MKIAVIADTHIPNCADSAEEAALAWAVETCRRSEPDVVVFAGDLTACGLPGELDRLAGILRPLGLPSVSTPGNSDLRSSQTAARARRRLSAPTMQQFPGVTVLALDTSDGAVRPAERRRFASGLAGVRTGSSKVVVTHWPPDELPAADRQWCASVFADNRVELVLAGHKHRDADTELAGVPIRQVRGLDPEKAIGAPPALTFFVRERGAWKRQETAWPAGDPRTWEPNEREGFLAQLGISTMSRTLADTAQAATVGARVLELRASAAMGVDGTELAAAVRRWRGAGGRELSVHLPDLRWDAKRGRTDGLPILRDAVSLSLRLGVERVTVHVPRAAAKDMTPGNGGRQAMLAAFSAALGPLAEAGVILGVENLHRTPGEPDDDRGRFGCTPPECLAWLQDLTDVLPSSVPRPGLLLDLGHARNNPPLSRMWTVGRWLAEAGPCAVGYHVHQVTAKGNHQPLREPFGPAISLSALFWAWRACRTARAPMFLEIRDESAMGSLRALRDFLQGR